MIRDGSHVTGNAVELGSGRQMAIPDYQTLMLPLLRLSSEGGEKRVPEIAGQIADEFGLSDQERGELLPSGRQSVLHNRMHWAKFYMSKAGLITVPSRGRFIASEEGRKLLASNPSKIDIDVLMQHPAFREFYKRESEASSAEVDMVGLPPASASITTPEERIETASAELHATLREELLERILGNTPTFFEELIVSLLIAMGYGGTHKSAARQLGRSGDGGVDGVIDEDRLGLDRVYVQAKRYALAHSIGRPDVQGFVGSLVGLGANKGVFVTTSTFSSHARDFVKHLGQRIVLIDGLMLADLMIEHDVGVRVFHAIAIKRLDEDFFTIE